MSQTIQFKITLLDSQPTIWRTFQLTDDYRLDRFHQVIQIIMGWQNSHLHEFNYDNEKYGMPSPMMFGDFDLGKDENNYFLHDLNLKENTAIHYLYDFGDGWEHEIRIEKIESKSVDKPICLDGKQAGPPEDMGGTHHYSHILAVKNNPKHPQYEQYKDWLPEGFDPDFFDLDTVNRQLYRFSLWRRDHPKAKSSPWHLVRE